MPQRGEFDSFCDWSLETIEEMIHKTDAAVSDNEEHRAHNLDDPSVPPPLSDTNSDALPPYLFGEEVDDEAKAAVAESLSKNDEGAKKLKTLFSDSEREKNILVVLMKNGFSRDEAIQIIVLMERGAISEDEIPLLVRLREKKTKFSLDKFVFVTKSKKQISGQSEAIFLEEGDDFGGLQHILHGDPSKKNSLGQLKQFQDSYGISDDEDKAKEEIAARLKDCISNKDVENQDLAATGRYCYKIDKTRYLCVVVGDNGYIVTAYPLDKKEYDRQAESLSGNK